MRKIHWLCNDNNRTRAKLAFSVIILLAFIIVGLFFFDIPRENAALVNMMIGFLAGYGGNVMGYYFGSSDSQTPEEVNGTPADKLKDKTPTN